MRNWMRNWTSLVSFGLLCGVVFALTSSCSLKPKSRAKFYIDISALKKSMQAGGVDEVQPPSQDEILNLGGMMSERGDGEISINSFPSGPSFVFPSPPSGTSGAPPLSGFNCFMVNVIGPGIPPQGVEPGDDPPNVAYGKAVQGGPFTYFGILSAPITTSAGSHVIQLDVPAGPGRLIQLIGLVDGGDNAVVNFCAGQGPLPSGPYFFEVAQTFVGSAFGDLAVNMTQDYSGNSQQFWYQYSKRLNGSGSCVAYSGRYFVSTPSSDTGIAFAVELNPSPNPVAVEVNDFLFEITVPAAVSIGAKIFVESNSPTGSSLFPSGYAAVVDANEVRTFVAAGTYVTNFRFPPTLLRDVGGGKKMVVLIYSLDSSAFSLNEEGAGSYGAPLSGSGLMKATTMAGWANATNLPYVIASRCY